MAHFISHHSRVVAINDNRLFGLLACFIDDDDDQRRLIFDIKKPAARLQALTKTVQR